MTGRIRSIKPEAHTDEALWDAETETGLPLFRAFTGLWCQADREGRFEWRPRPLKAAILPYWDGDFSRVLDALATRGLLVRYAFQGREYGVVANFLKHQYLNGKEPPSRLPAPPVVDANEHDLRPVERVRHASTTRAERVPHAPFPSLPIPIPVPIPVPVPVPVPDARARAEPTTDTRATDWQRDPTRAAFAHGPPETWPEVAAANDAFVAVYPAAGKLRGRDKRAVIIADRYADGFTLADLAEAAQGSKLDPHIAGNVGFQTVQTVWRDAGQIDKFKALLADPPRPGGPRIVTAADQRLRDQLDRVAMLEARERAAPSVAEGSQ